MNFQFPAIPELPHLVTPKTLVQALKADKYEAEERIRMAIELTAERDRAVDQVRVLRELAERTMATAEKHEAELEKLKNQLSIRDTTIAVLEARANRQAERISELENTLAMLAEADGR